MGPTTDVDDKSKPCHSLQQTSVAIRGSGHLGDVADGARPVAMRCLRESLRNHKLCREKSWKIHGLLPLICHWYATEPLSQALKRHVASQRLEVFGESARALGLHGSGGRRPWRASDIWNSLHSKCGQHQWWGLLLRFFRFGPFAKGNQADPPTVSKGSFHKDLSWQGVMNFWGEASIHGEQHSGATFDGCEVTVYFFFALWEFSGHVWFSLGGLGPFQEIEKQLGVLQPSNPFPVHLPARFDLVRCCEWCCQGLANCDHTASEAHFPSGERWDVESLPNMNILCWYLLVRMAGTLGLMEQSIW